MAQWTNDEMTAVLSEVARRSAVDLEFRALALKDPHAAIAGVSTKPFPTDFTVKFVDNSGKVKYMPLPDPVSDIEELSDAELAAIAGGDWTAGGNVSQGPSGPTVSGGATWHR